MVNKVIEQKVNAMLLEELQRTYPDKTFRLVGGEITVEVEDPIVGLVDSSSNEQNVSSYYRRNKKGEIKLVKGHSKKKARPSAIDVAMAQAKQADDPLAGAGIDVDKIVKNVTKTLSKPNSLGTMRA